MLEPWQDPAVQRWSEAIAASFRHWTGTELVQAIGALATATPPLAIYHAPAVVLAHDGAADPCFVYANAQAQALWEIPWQRFIGMPSRLSAAQQDRAERQRLLEGTQAAGISHGYRGVRTAASGRQFRILEATLWNVLDGEGRRIGQAVTFARWEYLDHGQRDASA